MSGEGSTLRFDPHVHTDASYDAEGSVHEVLAYAHNAALDAIAITDHDTTVAARQAIELADRYDVTVVPGVEISTADGHLLALGVVDRPPISDPLATSVEWVRDRGGLAVIPHPFQMSRHGVRKRDMVPCDGIEVFNAWSMTGIQNSRAESYAADHGYAQLGGSDAHEPSMIGQAYTEIETDHRLPVSASGVLESIETSTSRAVGQQTPTTKLLSKYTQSIRYQMSRQTD